MDFGEIFDAIISAISGGASKVGDFLTSNAGNLLQAGGAGLQAAPMLMQAFGGAGGQQLPDVGLNTQIQQPGGPTPQMMRARLADAQAAGLSGASPDFLANMSGYTPDELNQIMGLNYAGNTR